MDDMRSNILTQQESPSLFIAGNWRKRISCQRARDDLSLREKEKLIQKNIDDQIVPRGGEMTVEELVRKYLMQKTGVRHNTESQYNFVLNIIKKEEFGKRRIDKVK